MLGNYFKLAVRNLLKYRLITAINIFGLSIGIACASLAYLVVQHEYSYDKFHEESDHIYWFHTLVNEAFFLTATPGALSPELEANFPEITASTRFEPTEFVVVNGQEVFKETALLVDPNFFDFFSFSLLQGNPSTALSKENGIVLSEAMAKKYFGIQNPIGESLSIYYRGEEKLLSVTGVAQGAPANSSITFDFLLPLDLEHRQDEKLLSSNWNDFTLTSLVRLQDPLQAEAFEEKLMPFIRKKYEVAEEETMPYQFFIKSLESHHFGETVSSTGLVGKVDKTYMNILIIMAILILVVACLNFTNLSNARGSQRIMEVGLRQVMGARRQQLILQFLSESTLISLISVALAVPIIEGMLQIAQSTFDYQLTVNWMAPNTWLPLIGVALTTGLMAGAYPSFLLSNLNTIDTFKTDYKLGGNNWVTKVGLVFQFTLSIGLLACTLIMFQQQRYIQKQHLGYEKEEVIVVETQVQYNDGTNTEQMLERFKKEAFQHPDIQKISGVSYSFTRGNSGRMFEDGGDFNNFVFDYRIDPSYIDLLNLHLLEGRNFSQDRPEDQGKTIIVNQEFVKRFVKEGSWSDYQLPSDFGELGDAKIVGLVEDYNFLDLKQAINPLVLHMEPQPRFHHFLVKIEAGATTSALAHLQKSWQTIQSEKPFAFSFLDEDIENQYLEEARWNKVINWATMVSIVIAFLGLFGLVALSLAQRTKEIGIRKVLGASLGNLVQLFSWDFVQLLVLALVLASPIAWYFMQDWLSDFAYRISIQWWVFLLAGIAAGVLTLLIISVQSIRAGLANPVEALRSE